MRFSPALRLRCRRSEGHGAGAPTGAAGDMRQSSRPPSRGPGPGLILAFVLSWLGETRAQDTCLPPDRLQYAELEDTFSATGSFPIGAKVTYICRPGYMLIPGKPRVRTCEEDLRWSPVEPFCRERKCRHPGDLENGFVDVPSLTFGSTVTFSCEEGFRLRGTREISCVIKDKGVDWNRDLPLCERIPCEPPPGIVNGHYTEADSYVYQSSVTYTCNSVPKGQDPFSLIGTPTIFCLSDADSNGAWSGPPPQCKVVKCDNPTVENGRKRVGFGPSYSYRDSVVFECDPGYMLIGSEMITCGEDSTWFPAKPTCEKSSEDNCGHPRVTHGVVIPEKSVYDRGESVEIKCDFHCAFPDGTGEMTVTCAGQNTWTSLEQCECESKPTSGVTPHISHGQVVDGQKPSYSVGDFIRIECHTGYELHGEARIQYVGENQWNPGVPTCHLSDSVIAAISVAVIVILCIPGGIWVYKKYFSQNGSYTVDESCKETCILKTNVPAEMEETTQ